MLVSDIIFFEKIFEFIYCVCVNCFFEDYEFDSGEFGSVDDDEFGDELGRVLESFVFRKVKCRKRRK